MLRRLAVLLLVTACTATSHPSATPTPTPSSAALLPVAHKTLWLCQPDASGDPCHTPLDTRVVQANGSTVSMPGDEPSQPVDCFYVYPTVARDDAVNAPLKVEDAERDVAVAQAAPFSQVCRVYAPVYRQLTVKALFAGKYSDRKARALAHADVVSAFNDYLNQNPRRRFVLIGHSQGALELLLLLKERIDADSALRTRLVSALLIGGTLKVPKGKLVGGDLQHVPLCSTGAQTGCVVAYNSFDTTPPPTTLFGRPDKRRHLVAACTNPALLSGDVDKLRPLFPTTHALSILSATSSDVSYLDYLTAACHERNGFAWLQVSVRRVDHDTRPAGLPKALGPAWGLHLLDVNLALGNLVELVRREGT